MSMLSLYDATLDVGGNRLLDSVTWHIQSQDKIVLVGRNGAGKTSLLRLLLGEHHLDSGKIVRSSGLTVAGLAQEVPTASNHEMVYHFLIKSLGERGRILSRLFDLKRTNGDPEDLALCHQELDRLQAWDLENQVEAVASHLGIVPTDLMKDLSGGMKRRVLLAAALAGNPDLLILDEPTNHLDLEAIEWLETFLKSWKGSFVVVTHDREFASQVSSRIVEIDRGKLYSHECNFDTWLDRREAMQVNELRQQDLFDKKLADEETWIRTGIRARRTRNEGRVRALEAMRKEYRERKTQLQKMTGITLNDSKTSGMIVLEAEKIDYQIENRMLLKDFSLLVTRGDKLGIIGPNGCGKTTLIRLLLGDIEPQAGKIRQGTGLSIAWFDQLRTQLDDSLTLMQAVADRSDYVFINGQQKHVASYLKEFLFQPDQFNQAVSTLSGGERNRLLLARLLAKPVNLLVMDEPTNDLDMETLELLESVLVEYQGTLILISHDRQFIDAVVTNVLVYEGETGFHEYVGGYRDWQAMKQRQKIENVPTPAPKQRTEVDHKSRRELKAIPEKIEAQEAKIQKMQEIMADAAFYEKETSEQQVLYQKLHVEEKILQELYDRWSELEG